MKNLKSILLMLFASILIVSCDQQNTNAAKEKNVDVSSEKQSVTAVMKSYKDAIQGLTTEGTLALFSENSKIYESGGLEGTYFNYVAHHLGPELDHFNSFIFSDYSINVEIDLPYAFTTESYV